MQKLFQQILRGAGRLACAALLVLFASLAAYAQSTNIEFPTPVTATEVSGEIVARDIGDPRLTRHFYLLTGTPGDLVLTVESRNLNGDVDLFTSGTLRPLVKLSMYAWINATSTSKSIYLRRRESIILRVEARSANDDPGSYRIRFSGGFEPLAATTDVPENVEPTVSETARDRNARRVNSAGARLNEEPPAVSNTGQIETLTPATTVKTEEEEEAARTAATTTAPEKPAPARPSRTTRTSRARTPRSTRRTTPSTTTARRTETPAATTPAEPAPTAGTEAPPLGPRLIIETRDGARVERYMSQVRRMTVEKGQLVVITNDGKIERRAMSSVLRVTIEP